MHHFLIVGPGAMGCLFAARFKKARYDVTLMDYDIRRAAVINRQGISVQGIDGRYAEKVLTVTEAPPHPPDVVFICVKAYHTREAGLRVKPWVHPETVLVTLQNGIGNMEMLEDLFGGRCILGGITAEGATRLGPGKIRHAGRGETLIGSKENSGDAAEKIVAALNGAGFKARTVADVDSVVWGKLIINVGINALSAIVGVKNGRLIELLSTQQIMEPAVREAVCVAAAKKVRLPYADPLAQVASVCRATSGNLSSMLQDVLNEKITEVDFINGAVVREGARHGIPTPVNFTLTALVHAIQESYGLSHL